MKTMHILAVGALIGGALLTGVLATQKDSVGDGVPPQVPAVPQARSVGLLFAQRFEVATPFVHYWRSEQPAVASGWMLVLGVDPDLVHPRQLAEPVLYVGAQTAERVNFGHESGKVVAIVPGDFDLATAPIFFGSPALPEEVDAMHIASELDRAIAHGAAAPAPERIAQVSAPTLVVPSDYELRLAAADLIERFSPMEIDLIKGLRAPLVR